MPIVACIPTVDQTTIPIVEIPGVGALQAVKSQIDKAPAPYDLAATLISQSSPILAPIIQILRVVEVVFAIIDSLKAVKNPFKLARALKKTLKLLVALNVLLPGIPYIRLIRDILDLISAIVRGFVSLINRWIAELNLIKNALTSQSVLAQDDELILLIDCSKEHLNETITASVNTIGDITAATQVLIRLIEIVKSFIPGNIAQDIVDVFSRIAAVPSQLQTTQSAITAANSPDAIDDVIVDLQNILILMDETADRLDSISATLSGLVP
jgi:hypothetical protein